MTDTRDEMIERLVQGAEKAMADIATLEQENKMMRARNERLSKPITIEDIREAGGIVHSDGNIFFTNINKLNAVIMGRQ